MAGIKISALPAVTTANLNDIFPVVQGGVTSKETVTQLNTLLTTTLPFLNTNGGTMTGNLILNSSNPTLDLQAASKAYVDSVAQGLTIQGACRLGTTAALTVTYSNGASGVGATLTNAGAQAALTLDGVAAAVNDRILVKNQAATLQNGIYTVTDIGSGATNWVMTRATDYDQVAEIQAGDLVVINAGTTLSSSSWLQGSTVTTIGTSPITWTQFTTSLPINLRNGGTGTNLTASNGGIVYSTASTMAILPGTATANQVLLSGASGAPSFSTATYPVTTTANNLLYSSSANTIANLPLNASLAIQSGSLATVGGMVLLASANLAGAANADFTGLATNFSELVFVFDNLSPNTVGTSLLFNIYTGGTFIASAYTYQAFRFTSSANANEGATSQAGWLLDSVETLGNASDQRVAGRITVSNPSTTNLIKTMNYQMTGKFNSNAYVTHVGGCQTTGTAAAINGVRFYISSGTFATGTVYLYGMKNS